MSASLYSAQWYRVARRRPRLRPQVRVQRQQWREQRWYLLTDAATGRQHRINDSAYQFIGCCDGQRTVHEVWNSLLETQRDDAPTQEEVLHLLGQLNELELLQSERAADTVATRRRGGDRRKARRRRLLNPFSLQLPLADPTKWLERLDPLARTLFRPLAFWLWLGLVLLAALGAAAEWPALRAHAQQHLFSTASLAMAWLLYPLMKGLHEAGHALAVRRWGGEVHEVGIGLLFLTPAPYVDASAASAFPRRLQRAMVGAAGIMVELAVAALGLGLWLTTQPGWVHDAAFVLMTIGVTSTLLFNGNPLLRFDAYHVMCDLFDVPNLGARSAAWWNQRLGRWLLGSRAQLPPVTAGERKWLLTYAPLSFAYRVALSCLLVLWLGGHWLLLALLAALYVTVTVLLMPLRAWSRQALQAAAPGRDQARVRLRLGLVAAGTAALLFWVPLPHSTVAPAVVWLPEQAQVRPEVDGFVAALPLPDGASVKPGDLLVRLENRELVSSRDQIAARLGGLQVEQFQQLLRDANAAQNLAQDIQRTQAELARIDERIERLLVRAQVAGTLSMPKQGDLLGVYSRQGALLGHVLAADALRVRAAVPEPDAQMVRNSLLGAEVRLADAPQTVLTARVTGDTPAATRKLPSAALVDHGGGPYPNDPAETDGLHSLQPVVLIDLTLLGRTLERVGGRAWVRFDHGNQPLAAQAYRRAAQLFLQRFNPAG
jgi:putative peptide zinc metalloprotease protein